MTPVTWAAPVDWEAIPLALAGLLAVGLLLVWLWPRLATRLIMAVLSRSLLWLHVLGRDHVPRQGPVLLVCNPVSFLAWLLIYVACPRPVRVVLLVGWAHSGFPGWVLGRLGAIVPHGSDQAALEQALVEASAALNRGEVVCLFAEGCQTADGYLLPYHRIFQQVATHGPAPVVPVCLDQPQGSLVSLVAGRFRFKMPPRWPAHNWVRFGEVLPVTTGAGMARQALQELSARLAIERNPTRRPLHRQFVRMAARHPFRPCWIDSTAPGQDMTYARAYVGSVCLAGLLRPLLGDAAMVAVWLPPGRGGALTNVALALLGKTSVNLNYTAASDALQSALRQCACTHVLTARRFTARVPLDAGPGVELIYLDDLLPRLSRRRKLTALLSVLLLPGWFLERVVLRLGGHSIEQLATIIFSSGSTGEPKGVMLTHGNVAANVESMVQATSLGPTDRLLGVLPFFHSFGYTVSLWGPLLVGAAAIYHPDPRQAREIGELCRKHRCTIYLSTATFLRFCLKKCEADDFRSVRILMCGAEKLPPALALDFHRRFGLLPLEGYGCTELAPAAAANMPDQPFGPLTQMHNKIGTVGPPLPGCAARIIHPDTRQPLPLGEDGLLLITGANVMKGYLGRPDLTREVILDGWYVTGDMGRIDDDGHLTLTGRLSRFAKVGGEMVPLERIEEALHDILNTSERICAVTCVPDPLRGERIVVLYVAEQLTLAGLELRPWCDGLSDRGLPNLWLPGERDFFKVPELPVLGSGKLNLQRVQELALSVVVRK